MTDDLKNAVDTLDLDGADRILAERAKIAAENFNVTMSLRAANARLRNRHEEAEKFDAIRIEKPK